MNYGINPAAPSPLMDGYIAMKKSLPDDVVVLQKLGDFYEVFGDDAKKVAKALGITLTKRKDVPMAGIPYHMLDSSVKALALAGMRVAVAGYTPPKGVTTR